MTNEQFLEFIEAGGYENQNLWSNEDWTWISQNKISHPAFWKARSFRAGLDLSHNV